MAAFSTGTPFPTKTPSIKVLAFGALTWIILCCSVVGAIAAELDEGVQMVLT